MIKSMTGYGRSRQSLNSRDITVEVRSVNNRYLDCTVKMPRSYIFAEDAMKSLVQKYASRGKVDVFITVESLGAAETVVSVNEPLARSYIEAIGRLYAIGNGYVKGNYYATDLARLPDVLTVSRAEENLEEAAADLCAVLEEALLAHAAMREAEGRKLAEDIDRRLDVIEELVRQIEERSPQTVADYRQKLLERMQEVLRGAAVDESRILTEAAIFADKVAVDEETVRLRSHLAQMREMLQSGAPVGRKMDFLIQELNREANTIGSKCSDLRITRNVVDLKAEIEKIREQVQNIE